MKVPVLFYHKINFPAPEAKEKSLYVNPKNFHCQMRYLKYRRYNPIYLDELVKGMKGQIKLPPKPIVITFDDGYEDNYTVAFPILKEFGFKATIFLVTEDIGKISGVWMDSREKLKTSLLNWSQIEEMNKGGINFQSHTHTHPVLTKLNSEQIKKELLLSRRIIEEKLQKPVNFLCYPMGDFDERVEGLVKDTGYLGALTTKRGFVKDGDDLFTLKRIGIKYNKKIWNFVHALTFKYR